MKLDHPDFQLLLDELVGITKKILAKQGGFLPHGAIVSIDGKVGLVGALTKEEQPGSQKVLQVLEPALRDMAAKHKCRAIGMAIDIRLKAAPRKEDVGKDAIWVFLELKDGTAVSVFIPYRKSWLGGFTYGEGFKMPAKPRFFATPN